VGAQPLISFTFSGGLFFALLCIFKLIFFGLLTNHAGVAAVPCLTLMHHRTHTVVSSIRNPTPPCSSRGKNERSNVRVYTYALCKGGQIALNSKFGPQFQICSLLPNGCAMINCEEWIHLRVEIKNFAYGKSGDQLFADVSRLILIIRYHRSNYSPGKIAKSQTSP